MHDHPSGRVRVIGGLGLLWALVSGSAFAGPLKLLPQDCATLRRYGNAVAISDGFLAVGAPNLYGATGAGRFYVYRRGEFGAPKQVIFGSPGNRDGRFGSALAWDHQRLVVGGATVRVYEFDGQAWRQSAAVSPPDASGEIGFGAALAVSGDVLAVGAPNRFDRDHGSGAVYLFVREGNEWVFQTRLHPENYLPNGDFGSSLAMDGEGMIVGAPYANRAFYFRFDETSWVQKWAGGSQENYLSNFGASVLTNGDEVYVGAPSQAPESGGPGRAGVVFWYRWDGESLGLVKRLSPPGTPSGAGFGTALAIDGTRLVVGAGENIHGSCRPGVPGCLGGSTYVIERIGENDFAFIERVRSRELLSLNGFGYSVAVYDGVVVVGSRDEPNPCTSPSAYETGAVYVFESLTPDCNDNGQPDGEDISSAQSTDCNRNGVPDECELPPLCASCLDCNQNGVPDDCDAAHGDCNGNKKPDECDVPPICPLCLDCNQNLRPDSCDLRPPNGSDCNGNRVPDECEVPPICPHCLDCDQNHRPDSCELRASTDCNRNRVLDDCEVPPFCPSCIDCNENRVPDACEVPPICRDCTDCLRNGIPDDCDFENIAPTDCNQNEIPDACEVGDQCDPCSDCNQNLAPDDCDIDGGTSSDCNANRIPDECESGFECPECTDCNANGLPDRCDVNGESADCNRNLVPDECEVPPLCSACPDCNANSIPDLCDVYSPDGMDCNHNSIPDECELDELCDGCNDCNANRFPDECELYYGRSDDCNGNLVPDECDPDCDGDGQADACHRIDDLQGTERTPRGKFGWTVAVKSDVAIFGEPLKRLAGTTSLGSAHIYRKFGSAWMPEQMLTSGELESPDLFGEAVAIDGEWAAVGAPSASLGEITSAGAVYVFKFNGSEWGLHTTIHSIMPISRENFGGSVALHRDVLLIGAPRFSQSSGGSTSYSAGRAFAYRWNGASWAFEQELLPWLGSQTRGYGANLGLSEGLCLVAAIKIITSGYEPGGVFAFQFRDGVWHPVQHINPTLEPLGGAFGGSIAMEGTRALIGSNAFSSAFFLAFDGTSWVVEGQTGILPGAAVDYYQWNRAPYVALDGSLAVVGAPSPVEPGEEGAGLAYVFQHGASGWGEYRLIEAAPAWRFERFGHSVGLGGQTLFVGASGEHYSPVRPRDWRPGHVFSYSLIDMVGDTDFDGLRTHSDFRRLSICLTQTEALPTGETRFACVATFDFDHDEDVDLADVAAFLSAFGCGD